MSNDEEFQVYKGLGPDAILDAANSAGFVCDGLVQALSNCRNWVDQVSIEDGGFVVTNFYRPARRTDESIVIDNERTLPL